ncbi:hypothetical protein J2755_000627 [Methanohalophilus levihalophilus]|uniref:hypothetical protein n=1 Tax=Methanohalophilus levihalophilus TaxID=1431282 RepID=UPI001AE7F178|nr:hypothetical protein [Methanohalophilus levihalophilus]MBP2029707.1 hypothetical protein [Methanohalophilus levihalophilus]
MKTIEKDKVVRENMKAAVLILCLCLSSLFLSGCVDNLDLMAEETENITFSARLDVYVKESDGTPYYAREEIHFDAFKIKADATSYDPYKEYLGTDLVEKVSDKNYPNSNGHTTFYFIDELAPDEIVRLCVMRSLDESVCEQFDYADLDDLQTEEGERVIIKKEITVIKN